MNKLTKLLVLSSIASATLFANDNLVIDFDKKRLSQNPNVKASNIKIFYKKVLTRYNASAILTLTSNKNQKGLKKQNEKPPKNII